MSADGQPDLFSGEKDEGKEDEVDALLNVVRTKFPSIHADATDTERYAARKIYPHVGTWRERILLFVVSQGERGATGWETVRSFGGPVEVNPYTIRPIMSELKNLGLLADSGDRRENARGNPEIVLIASGKARRVAARSLENRTEAIFR